jgi:hypothetical protein
MIHLQMHFRGCVRLVALKVKRLLSIVLIRCRLATRTETETSLAFFNSEYACEGIAAQSTRFFIVTVL